MFIDSSHRAIIVLYPFTKVLDAQSNKQLQEEFMKEANQLMYERTR